MDFFSDDNLDVQQNQSNQNNIPRPFPYVFAPFAKSLGIFSIFCAVFSVFFGSFICGGLAIVLAILSKGYNTNMEKNAKIGIAAGIIGIVLQLSLLIFSIYSILYIPEYREQFNSLYEQMTGEPLDDSINELLNEMGLPSTEEEIL